jgi:excisionase family DNA binding protein
MSIRLRAVTGLLQVTVRRCNFAGAIDKNCGEIEKKYWTEVRGDFTLEADRQREVPHGKYVRVRSVLRSSPQQLRQPPAFAWMKKSVCGLKRRIGGTMLYQKTTELVSNGVIGRRLLNVKEAAQYLGLEVDTVYRKSRLREVPCVKVGRALRFDMRALERYIEQHTIETID